jgi:phosphoribosylglycinamide formyltransferase-1
VSRRDLRFAMVVSTSGSAMNEVLKSEFFRSRVHRVVVHDAGPAHDNARRHGVTTTIVPQEDVESFCAEILILFQSDEIDYVFSFYTEFFSTEFRRAYQDRVLNFHPSLLPAFKGMDGFGDTVRYPARFAGNTVELIADAMDEGKIVMQTVCAVDPGAPTGSCSSARRSCRLPIGCRRDGSPSRAIGSAWPERRTTAHRSLQRWTALRPLPGLHPTPTAP